MSNALLEFLHKYYVVENGARVTKLEYLYVTQTKNDYDEKLFPIEFFRESIRGIAGVARATPIFQVLFHKTSRPQTIKPTSPKAKRPLSSSSQPSNHQAPN